MSNENNGGSNSKLSIDLEKREDANGKIYYIGRIKAPIVIDCKEGVAFLCFTSEEGNEQLQICSFNKPNNKYNDNR